jgi:hypothetical protein
MRSFNITHYIVHYFHFFLFSLSLLHDVFFLIKRSCMTPPEDGFFEAETYVGVIQMF